MKNFKWLSSILFVFSVLLLSCNTTYPKFENIKNRKRTIGYLEHVSRSRNLIYNIDGKTYKISFPASYHDAEGELYTVLFDSLNPELARPLPEEKFFSTESRIDEAYAVVKKVECWSKTNSMCFISYRCYIESMSFNKVQLYSKSYIDNRPDIVKGNKYVLCFDRRGPQNAIIQLDRPIAN